MGRSVTLRLAAAVLLGIVPAAIMLAALAASGAASAAWVIAVIGMGLIAGGASAMALAATWRARAERLDAIASALEHRRPPSHLMPDEGDALSRAERRLLAAADEVVGELGSLVERRGEFDAILRSMSEAVVVTASPAQVVLLNGAARRMFALHPEAGYRGRDFVELCRDPRLQEFVARATALAPGESTTAELLIQNPAPRTLEVSSAPVPNSNAAAALRVFVFHDISRLKSFETARADFVANLTHEMRTPLSALYGYAETLAKGVDDPATQHRFLGIIERQARRLARLIDDLISLSDLERGLTPLKPEPLEPVRVLEEASELMREQARRAGVALEIRCAPNLPPMTADHDRIHQVMLNLIDNAIKYTPRGGSVIAQAASAQGGEPSRAGIELIITDTGEGIPAADIPRLTERFYRVDRARSRELGGTGLGLAIVRHIVQLHGGTLKIESRLREGTTVTVWLPLEPDAETAVSA